MAFGDFILRLIFLVETGVGVLGNALFLAVCASMYYTSHAPKPTHLILTNMTVRNFLILLFNGIPQCIYIWGIAHILGKHGCNVALYIYKMSQSLSLSTNCLLNNYQAISIIPRVIGWMGLKSHIWKISVSCFLCWMSSLLMNIFDLVHTKGLQNMKNSTRKKDYGLFSSQVSSTSESIYRILRTLSDFILIGLMFGASVYMILLFYRHCQRIRNFHKFSVSHRLSSETKATQNILLLTSIFILHYFTKSIHMLDNAAAFKYLYWLQHVTTFLSTCYPTVNPMVLMVHDCQVPIFCS